MIDFGQNDEPTAADGARQPREGEPGHALVKGLEKLKLQKQGADGAAAGGRPGHLKRIDSETNEVDDFADAES